MPAGGDQGSKPAQNHAHARQEPQALTAEARHPESAPVLRGQLPDRLVSGLDSAQIPFAVPGTRRSGGITSSLTGGLETRRKNISLSTFHALSTLFYGVLESRPIR